MSIAAREWLDLLEREYLEGFVRGGGAAVKLAVVGDRGRGDNLLTEVERVADAHGYLCARVDATRVKVHMMQDVFFAVAERVEWERLAAKAVRRFYAESGMNVPESGDLSAEAVAAHNRVDASKLHGDMRRASEAILRQGSELAKDFRIAMTHLCMAQIWPRGSVDAPALLEWLHGELRLVSALRDHLIFRKIGRHNARAMLASLGSWARTLELPGLVLTLDLRRLAVGRRADVSDGHYYTKPAVMDAYEVLRQLIDATDDLRGMLCVVLMEPGQLEDEARGVRTYKALDDRIRPDVRLRQRDNPLSALTRLEEAEAA